ncbi:calcium/sodium antiporter [Alteribacter natronophilus]|uniref:calcium/sodium antiporter n=1 Tax=Alteribacter natronophilus TaxID=2583810 RepID=UPI00110D82E4|nr:calcium/sodium antiporter [Alteribacter natronophilus]TMW72855.1 calcium/sodium antiporter [Alteribacter natronophilus]
MLPYILLVGGFLLLIKGAGWFVDGASNIGALLKISPLVIGLTIVAFGTGAPEATVSILAALKGSADVAVGNVVGSNLINITMVVGVTAIIAPITVKNQTIRKEIPFALLSAVALLIFMSDSYLEGTAVTSISRSEGVTLLLFFTVFMYYIIEAARNNQDQSYGPPPHDTSASGWMKQIILTAGGLAAIIFGGELVVRNALEIAYRFGMSETLAGLTIVAVGTALPEFATCITAALKGKSEIAVGNIIGSNIFNTFFVIGLAAIILPLDVDARMIVDVILMCVMTVVLLVFSRTRFAVGKYEGAILTAVYLIYLVYIIFRN